MTNEARCRGVARARGLVAAVLAFAAGVLAVGVGDTAPAFALPTAAGEPIALDKLKGRVVYVDFWASWCGPCRRSFPWMNEMQQKYGARGFTVVGDQCRQAAPRRRALPAADAGDLFDRLREAGKTPEAYAVKGDAELLPRRRRRQGRRGREWISRRAEGGLEERIRALLPAR